MEKPATAPPRRLPKVVRVIRARPRLFIAALLAAMLSLLLPAQWRVSPRVLVGWDVAVAFYLLGALRLMAGADAARIRRRAAILDEGRLAILMVVVGAAGGGPRGGGGAAGGARRGGPPSAPPPPRRHPGRGPSCHPDGRGGRRGREPRRDRGAARRRTRGAPPCARDSDHPALMDVGARDIRAALRARVLCGKAARRRSDISRRRGARLLGLPLLFAGDRDDLAGLGRGGHRPHHSPHRGGARGGIVPVQRGADRAQRQHRGERAGVLIPKFARPCRTLSAISAAMLTL